MTGASGIRTVTVMTTTANETLDPTAVEEFAGRIFGLLTDGMLTYMIDLGHRTGLFDATAEGPGTSDEIADRDGLLVDAYLPLVPGLSDRLRAGARVADVACGSGHALVVLGRAFPASTFVGYDLDEDAIARARAEAAAEGLGNVSFEVCDVARL